MSDMEKNPGSKAGGSDVKQEKEFRQKSRQVRCQTGKKVPAAKPAGRMSEKMRKENHPSATRPVNEKGGHENA